MVHGPNLGLSTVDLNDGSYSTTLIYPVSGAPGNQNQNKAVGRFYVQFDGDLCAYHIPGGSFAMRFTGSDFVFVDDGAGGQFLEGTFELTIIEATGVYRPFVGGHNHMVDRLHFLASGDIDEYCFCFISLRERDRRPRLTGNCPEPRQHGVGTVIPSSGSRTRSDRDSCGRTPVQVLIGARRMRPR